MEREFDVINFFVRDSQGESAYCDVGFPFNAEDSPDSSMENGVSTAYIGLKNAGEFTLYLQVDNDVISYKFESVPQLEYPENGHVFESSGSRVCPFKIILSENDPCAYYVKLVDPETEEIIISFFVCPGQSVEHDVPLGTYELRYASGSYWYGEKFLFGKDTVLCKSSELLEFAMDSNYYNGCSIELYKQEGGNFSTESISAGSF